MQWDQRGAGRTFGRNGAQTPNVSLDRIVEDGLQLAQVLNSRFGRKIIVIGHSWGSVVAVEMVRRRPDLFSAYVGTGQVAGWSAGIEAQYEYLKRIADTSGSGALRAALDEIGALDTQDQRDLRIVNREIRK